MLTWWFNLNRKFDSIPEPERFFVFLFSFLVFLCIPMIFKLTLFPMIDPELTNLVVMCIIGILRFVYIIKQRT